MIANDRMLKFRVDAYRDGVFQSTAICGARQSDFDDGVLYWQRAWQTKRGLLTYKATPIDT